MENIRVWRPKQNMNVLKTGYLLKQSELRQWQRRYFVLTKGSLCYYRKEENAVRDAPRGLIFFNDMSLYIEDIFDKQPKYCLKIVKHSVTTPKIPRTFTLCSFSQQERNEWLSQILLAKATALVLDRSWMGGNDPEKTNTTPKGCASPMMTARGAIQKYRRRLSVGTIQSSCLFEELRLPPKSPRPNKIPPSLQWKSTPWSTLKDYAVVS